MCMCARVCVCVCTYMYIRQSFIEIRIRHYRSFTILHNTYRSQTYPLVANREHRGFGFGQKQRKQFCVTSRQHFLSHNGNEASSNSGTTLVPIVLREQRHHQ